MCKTCRSTTKELQSLFAVQIGGHVACTLHAGLGGVADGTNHKTSKSRRVAPSAMSGTFA